MVSSDLPSPAAHPDTNCPAGTAALKPDRMTRPPFERMHYIHSQLAAERHPNCSSIARHFEMSPRTIQRDIDYMRDRLQLPIDYDPSHRGYFYTQPVSSLPTLQLSHEEIISLLVARQAVAHYPGSPWAPRIDELIRKMNPDIGEPLGTERISTAISFHTTGMATVDGQIFRAVCDAVLQQREIRFRYRQFETSHPDERAIHPYHLGCVNGAWHVVGLTLGRDVIRVYALERIHDLSVTDTQFKLPAPFSPGDYFARAFGILVEEGLREVVLRFRGRAAWEVSQRVWHPTQRITPLADGGVELRLHVSCVRELVGWVMGWGEHVTVLAPAELSTQISARARGIANLYACPGGDSLAPFPATVAASLAAPENGLANAG